MQALSNLSEPENNSQPFVHPLEQRNNEIGKCLGCKNLRWKQTLKNPIYAVIKAFAGRGPLLLRMQQECNSFQTFQSKTKENSAVLNFFKFSIFY